MPLTVAEYLAAEDDLRRLRAEVESCDRHDLRRLRAEEAAMVKLCVTRWDNGVAGWMTPDEAAVVAAELTADAERQQLAARAEVRDGYLVFVGGRCGEQLLLLKATSPIRARKHWPGYLQACSSTAPTRPGLLRRMVGSQLDLLTRAAGWAGGKRGQR